MSKTLLEAFGFAEPEPVVPQPELRCVLDMFVPGKPEPQGNKTMRHKQRRFPERCLIWMTEGKTKDSIERFKSWRGRVRDNAKQEARYCADGPCELFCTFYMRRPASHWTKKGDLSATGKRNPFPATKPDRDKLLRTIGDALEGVALTNDSRVVGGETRKRWAEDENKQPGVQVTLYEITYPEKTKPPGDIARPEGFLDNSKGAV